MHSKLKLNPAPERDVPIHNKKKEQFIFPRVTSAIQITLRRALSAALSVRVYSSVINTPNLSLKPTNHRRSTTHLEIALAIINYLNYESAVSLFQSNFPKFTIMYDFSILSYYNQFAYPPNIII